MVYHRDLMGEHIHTPYSWKFADTSARTSVTGLIAGDVGKTSWQQDNNTFWVLTNDSPVTWVQLNIDTAHRVLTNNPHGVNKTDVGLSSVPNTDFTTPVSNNTTHAGLTNNPHSVDKTDVGLSNVTNVDTTNASNITTGTLPSSVIPPVALVTVQLAANQTAHLALTTEEGDVVVRTDEDKTYMHNGGSAGTMADFTELNTPDDIVLSVNGDTGTVILNKADVGLSNVPNTDFTTPVANNTSHRSLTNNPHSVNKTDVGLSSVPNTDFTTPVSNNTTHAGLTNNPHSVDKADVGLSSVPNTNFTTPVADNTTHRGLTNNPHGVSKSNVGLGLVPNTNFTTPVASNTTHRGLTNNPHSVNKTDVGLSNVPNTNCTNASNITTGTLLARDHGAAATDQVVNVCYGTGAAPTANTTTIGSLFIKYTA